MGAGIYANVGNFKRMRDFDNERRADEGNALALMVAKSRYDEGQQEVQRENALRGLTLTGDDEVDYGNMRRISPKAADAHRKSQLDAKKTKADIGKTEGETSSKKLLDKIKASEFHIQQLGPLQTMEEIEAWNAQGVRDGVVDFKRATAGLKQFAEYAATHGFDAAKQMSLRGGMSATEQLKADHDAAVRKEQNRHNVAGETEAQRAAREREANARGQLAVSQGHLGLARAKDGRETQGTYDPERGVIIDRKAGTYRPVTAADGTPLGGKADGKPLPGQVVKTITEARDNAATIGNLQTSFKPEYASKGVLGIGADASLAAKATLGTDKDSVEWWKNYRKQSELTERHALFGGALTPTEQASWRSADIGPGMDAKVIATNLKTRADLAQKVADFARQDQIDAGHSADRIDKIAGRKAPEAKPTRTVVRTGTDAAGKKVVQYSDGSIEHAN